MKKLVLLILVTIFFTSQHNVAFAYDCNSDCANLKTCFTYTTYDFLKGKNIDKQNCVNDPIKTSQCIAQSAKDCILRAISDDGNMMHGNYCGRGQKGVDYNKEPSDALDEACMDHDRCWDLYGDYNCSCDRKLSAAAFNASTKPHVPSVKAISIATYFSSSLCWDIGFDISATNGSYEIDEVRPRIQHMTATQLRNTLRAIAKHNPKAGGKLLDGVTHVPTLVIAVETMDLETLKRTLENVSHLTLKSILHEIDDATVQTALNEVDDQTLRQGLKEIDLKTFKNAIELIRHDRLEAALVTNEGIELKDTTKRNLIKDKL